MIVKNYPNSFTATDLNDRLAPDSNLVLAGFMTHMCVNSTARGAFSLGHSPTVVSGGHRDQGAARARTASRSARPRCRRPAWPRSPTCSRVVVPKASEIPD